MTTVDKLLEIQGAFLVGSRQWGGSTAFSDYDIVIPVAEKESTLQMLKETHSLISTEGDEAEEYTENPESVYVKSETGHQINLIFLGLRSHNAWHIASKAMQSLPKCVLEDRTRRRYIFTMIVDALRHLAGEL